MSVAGRSNLQFAPGVELTLPGTPLNISIKGVTPQLNYGESLTELYASVPVLSVTEAYLAIYAHVKRARNLLAPGQALGSLFMVPVPRDEEIVLQEMRRIFDPIGLSPKNRLIVAPPRRVEAGRHLFSAVDVSPFPLIQAPHEKLVHTLAWVDTNIKVSIEQIGTSHGIKDGLIVEIVRIALTIYALILKMDNFRLVREISFNHSMFLQERIVQMVFGHQIYDAARPLIGATSNLMAIRLLGSLGPLSLHQLCELSVFMGIVWTSTPARQREFVDRGIDTVDSLLRDLEHVRRRLAIDHTERLFADISQVETCVMTVVLDDNGESVFDIAIIERLLAEHTGLTVAFIVNRFPVSNNISLPTFRAIISEPTFAALKQYEREKRMTICIEDQMFRSFEPAYLSSKTLAQIERADIVYIKGANFFETFQLPDKTCYYCFTVSGPTGVMLTGYPEGAGIFARVSSGAKGFEYSGPSAVWTLRNASVSQDAGN